MLNFCQGGVLTGYNGAAYLKCSLSHTKGKSAVGQKYFLIVSPALCFTLLTRWIHSAFLEKTWIYSEADLEWSFSPLEITENPSMLTNESLPSIILPLYFLLFLILLFSFMFLLCFNISLFKYWGSFISCCFSVLDTLQQHGNLQVTVHGFRIQHMDKRCSFLCEVFPLMLTSLTQEYNPCHFYQDSSHT